MGLAASQARYLALTARKSDLEYQSQTINTRRLQLAYKTADIAKAYSEGMNNECIAISEYSIGTDGKTTKKWSVLDWDNLYSNDYMVIGIGGKGLDPCPYQVENYTKTTGSTYKLADPTKNVTLTATEYNALGVTAKTAFEVKDAAVATTGTTEAKAATYKLVSTDISATVYGALGSLYQECLKESVPGKTEELTEDKYTALTAADKKDCTVNYKKNPDYVNNGGMDLQSLLVSAKGQIVTKKFYDYLVSNYGYNYSSGVTKEAYAEALQNWENNENDCNPGKAKSTESWRADTSSTFKPRSYTEDDDDVLAKYEAETAEVQAQDKILEVQEKNIETQHKAIETEMENVKKVIQKNIEETFKIFS